MKIGDAIKSARTQKKVNQKDLAETLGITQTYLSLIENNKKSPNFHILEKIGQSLDIPVPIILFMSLNDEDIKQDKKEMFKFSKPFIDKFIEDIFIEND